MRMCVLCCTCTCGHSAARPLQWGSAASCCCCSASDPAIGRAESLSFLPTQRQAVVFSSFSGYCPHARQPSVLGVGSARARNSSRLRRDGTATASGLPLALCTSARPHRAGALAHLHTRATSSRRAREHRAAAAPAAARVLQVLQRARAGAQLHCDAAALSAAAGGATPRAPRALSRLRAHCRLCYGRQA